MSAFTLTVRILLTSATLVALLGPTFADAVAREDVPPPPAAEPSGGEEEDVRSRSSRRERRGTAPRDGMTARDLADAVGRAPWGGSPHDDQPRGTSRGSWLEPGAPPNVGPAASLRRLPTT